MKIFRSLLLHLLADEAGQVLPWMMLLVILFLGMAGLTVDLGRAWVCYRELQASTDAAALAGAYAMTLSGATTSSIANSACAYSANTNISPSSNCSVPGVNDTPNLPTVSTTPSLKCVSGPSYITVPCGAAALGMNVIQVTQTATIPTYFIQALGAFGFTSTKTLTLNAMSSATLSGSTPPVAVAILIDTTASMGPPSGWDSNCGDWRIHCALQGVQSLLEQVPTCAETDPNTGACTQYNYIALFTFPDVEADTVSQATTCTGSGNPTVVPYTWPNAPVSGATSWTAPTGAQGTYQIAGFDNSFNTGTGSASKLSSASPLVTATGAGGCTGLQTPGGDGTYYAGAINAAQSALMAQVNGNTNIQKVMIILSDGAANSTRICATWSATNPAQCTAFARNDGDVYGSAQDQCSQAIDAAANASALGTKVYTIAYASESSGCTTDGSGPYPGISPCTTMKDMATGYLQGNYSNFYSDAGSAGVCGSGGGAALPTIFSQIYTNLSQGRLIPNS